MKVIQNNDSQTLILTIPTDYKLDLGKEDNLKEFEKETLQDIINPIENFETSRFMHLSYSGQCDIWFEFYFYNTGGTHTGGLNYEYVGIDMTENAKMLKQATKSFFRLEFYKIPEGEKPEKMNRRLVFAKNLSLPLGERVFHTTINDYIYVPVFVGSNIRNKENMYLFWFQDDSALTETILTGDTFYMTARFFNGDDGSINNFANKSLSTTQDISENDDIYYQVVFDYDNYTYQVYQYNGSTGNRNGQSGTPIRFYEIMGGG